MLSEDNFEDDLTYEAMVAIEFYKGLRKGYEEGFHLGELRALHSVIADTIQERFPSLVTLAASRIQRLEDTTQLRHLIVELSNIRTDQEAEQTLRSILKDAQQH